MATVEVGLKSPLFPSFSKGKSLGWIPTPLWKRGEGKIFGRNKGELCREFLGQDTRLNLASDVLTGNLE
jgi:hypothetical protein